MHYYLSGKRAKIAAAALQARKFTKLTGLNRHLILQNKL